MLGRVVRTSVLGLVIALASTLLLTAPAATASGDRHATRWDCLAHYESSHRWWLHTGNGYYGGLQFSLGTWRYYGGESYSHNYWPQKATRREQIVIAKRVAWHGWRDHRAQGGRHAWPSTWYRCF